MSFWGIIFIVAMAFWLFGGGFLAYGRPEPDRRYAFGSFLLPWVCVAILGYMVCNGIIVIEQPVRYVR